jgi:hypothetical protein
MYLEDFDGISTGSTVADFNYLMPYRSFDLATRKAGVPIFPSRFPTDSCKSRDS